MTPKGRSEAAPAPERAGAGGTSPGGAPDDLAAALPALPRDDAGPVFKAPWEAQAFAMAVALHARGAFTWPEWAETLAEIIAEVRERGEPDTGEQYYRHWLTALERIATRKGLVTGEGLVARRHAWEEAARRTPHGQPIHL